jgi:L-cysteine S-thiosulfotransferase
MRALSLHLRGRRACADSRISAASCGLAALLLGSAVCTSLTAQAAPERRSSGYDAMSPQLQAMQRDDSRNPGMLWVKEGEALWQRSQGETQRSCASCHDSAASSMQGVATRYPALDALTRRPVDLAARINLCRVRHQRTTPLAGETPDLLALTAYVAVQSRGMPMSAATDPALAPFRARGEALYRRRLGQLDLSCSDCHDRYPGRHLGGSVIPPADPAPYPAYRLQWQALGSLQRRIRNCLTGVRAEPFAYGAEEMIDLELYLAHRAEGVLLEAPGIRP